MYCAENVALIDECITEISRMTYSPLSKHQNYVVACFDKQVNPHAILKAGSTKYLIKHANFYQQYYNNKNTMSKQPWAYLRHRTAAPPNILIMA